jgi:uncharacterized protein with PIN domain
MSPEPGAEQKFIADRMLGTLTRYLRFMGYDTTSAKGLTEGDRKEDTVLLEMAQQQHRLLLTKDAELARRGDEAAVLIRSDDVIEQVQQLIDLHLVKRRLTMSRCSLCNTPLREATTCEIEQTEYAPKDWRDLSFFWCRHCRKLYWNGSHGKRLEERVDRELKE